jgi:hypothetical protein
MMVVVAVSGCEFGETPPVGGAGPSTCDAIPQCDPNAMNPDPLHTCNETWDAHDCLVLEAAKNAGEPDPMIFKAQMSLESNFNVFAISPDSPCGPEAGWTDEETKSFGLMQLTPACGWLKNALLPNGHPNMTSDAASMLWGTSVYNPMVNVVEGVRAVQVFRDEVMRKFPGCTPTQYTVMALAAFNQGGGSVTGCNMLNTNGALYVSHVLGRYADIARLSNWPVPY